MEFNEVYPHTCSTVSVAARQGNIDALKALLNKGKPYDVKDNRGWTCIHEAASGGHVQCLNVLLELDDIDVDIRTFEWETALMLASANGHADCVTSLIRHGADPNSQTHDLDSALCLAAKESQIDCIKELISGGADVNKKYFTEDSPLHIAVSQHGNKDVVSCLVDAGADLFSTNEHKLTPLFLAAQFGHCDILKLFIDKVISTKGEETLKTYIDMAAYDDATPLYVATQGSFADCVEILLAFGADPCKGPSEDEEKGGATIYPLQVAIYQQSYRCFQLLLASLDFVLKEYDNNESLQTRYLKFHPFILAQECDDSRFLRTLFDKARVPIDCIQNIFYRSIDLAGAITYIKRSKDWIVKMYKSYVCNHGFTTPGKELCLLMLRHGQDQSLIDSLHYQPWYSKPQSIWGGDSLLLILIKYLHRYCQGDACSSRCILKQMTYDLSEDTYLMRLCLMPYVSSLKAIRSNDGEDTKSEADDTYEEELKSKISEMLVSNSLKHNCRIAIVFHLVQNDMYNEKAIDSLDIPEMMKDYIKYTEYDEIGERIITGFQALDDAERLVDSAVKDWSGVVMVQSL